jgi:hypothetical protein
MFGSKTTSANANSPAPSPNISRAARKTSSPSKRLRDSRRHPGAKNDAVRFGLSTITEDEIQSIRVCFVFEVSVPLGNLAP